MTTARGFGGEARGVGGSKLLSMRNELCSVFRIVIAVLVDGIEAVASTFAVLNCIQTDVLASDRLELVVELGALGCYSYFLFLGQETFRRRSRGRG